MPEFPEVHHQIVWLRTRVAADALIDDYGYTGGHFPELKDDPAKKAKLDAFFKGATLKAITQRGKHIVMALSTGTCTSHLMHSGRWTTPDQPYVSSYRHHKDLPSPKASTFWMSVGGRRLEFNEPEYRGKVRAFPGLKSDAVEELRKLGPDVMRTSESDPAYPQPWTVDAFRRSLSGNRKSVKEILLDQAELAGVGNTYACEALYRAGIAPTTKGAALAPERVHPLHLAVVDTINDAVATDLDYDRVLKVYRKETDPQGRKVEVVKIGGRDTYWVPEVQR